MKKQPQQKTSKGGQGKKEEQPPQPKKIEQLKQTGVQPNVTIQKSLEQSGQRLDSELQAFRSKQETHAMEKNFELTYDPKVAEMSVGTTQNTNSVKAMIKAVKNQIEIANNFLVDYKRDIQQLRQELTNLENKLATQIKDIPESTLPQIQNFINDLGSFIKSQQSENSNLQKQITNLKKEKTMIQQKIVEQNQKLDILEMNVGVDHPHKHYT